MNDPHTTAQHAGSAFIALLAAMFYYAARRPMEPSTMKQALIYGATYLAFVVVVRVATALDMLTQVAGRVVNGWVAAVFVIALVEVLIVTPLIVRARMGRR